MKMDQRLADGEKTYIHASAVAVGEAGVLIQGPSGAGKSSLAFALIVAAKDTGLFARLVGDDRVGIDVRNGRVIARGHPSVLGKMERRGQGIFEMPYLPAAIIRGVILLAGHGEDAQRYPEPDQLHTALAGIRLPLMRLRQDAAPGNFPLAVLADLRLRGVLP